MPNACFIVIEGLDGSGKTTASRHLAELLKQQFPGNILRTFEPNDQSCGGDYIRQVLRKEIEIFNPRTLALAFAANRLDHGDRIISPWLAGGENRIVICDRYYLSSLVYQSAANFSMQKIMKINELAKKPDLIFFIDVTEEVCFERMKNRNMPEELFEKNFRETREKYIAAIEFLRRERKERIVEINGCGTEEEVVRDMLEAMHNFL